MPIRTTAQERPDRQPRSPDTGIGNLPQLIAAAAVFAAAELLAGLLLGGFFAMGRAEALPFFLFRPWLLLAGSLIVAGLPWRRRALFYALALLLAALGESLFLIDLGADHPWPEAARGAAAGALLALLFDVALQLGRRVAGRTGQRIAGALLVVLLLIPAARTPYEAIALGRGAAPATQKRDLMMLSALPLVWGELGPFDAGSKPAEAYRMLEREFRIRPLDLLDSASLGTGKLLLLAQPRALAPAEFAALDAWVRGGGRVLILTDPMLAWPSELPLGDIRRAPAIGLMGPLLVHWGLELERPGEAKAAVLSVETGREERRLVMFAPGHFASRGGCRLSLGGAMATCAPGKGRAILLADADMLHDRLWVAPGSAGAERHGRVSDNPLIVADLLDTLAGTPRRRGEAPVEWIDPAAEPATALLLALIPLLVAAAAAGRIRVRRAR